MKGKDIAALRKMLQYAVEIQDYVKHMDYSKFLLLHSALQQSSEIT